MDRTVFRSHGAGLPSDVPIERTDEGFVHYTNATYEEFGVVPGSVAGHELVVGDDRYDLVERADGPVVISVTDRTPIDALLQRASGFDRGIEERLETRAAELLS